MRKDIRQDEKLDNEKGIRDNEKGIRDLVRGFVGRNMTVTLRSKKILTGRLESVTHYELLLTISQKPVLIMKHAIDYIELIEATD